MKKFIIMILFALTINTVFANTRKNIDVDKAMIIFNDELEYQYSFEDNCELDYPILIIADSTWILRDSGNVTIRGKYISEETVKKLVDCCIEEDIIVLTGEER